MKNIKQVFLLTAILAVFFVLAAAPALANTATVTSITDANSNLTAWITGTEPHILMLDADNWTGTGTITIPSEINNLKIQSNNESKELNVSIVAASRTTVLNLTIKDLNLNVTAASDQHGIDIDGVTGTTLFLEDNNTIRGNLTGVHVGYGNFLTITAIESVKDTNHLKIYGGESSAGIGGSYQEASGEVVINGFVVIDEAMGGNAVIGGGGAAIGGGGSESGTVTISGPVRIKMATGGNSGGNGGGAAIGGGGGDGAGTVTVSNAAIIESAIGGCGEYGGGAAIGGGGGGANIAGGAGTVTISNAAIIEAAMGGTGDDGGGAAIGSGGCGVNRDGKDGIVTVSDATIIKATGGPGGDGCGAAIGSGGGGYSGVSGAGIVTLSNATIIEATGGRGGVDSGGGAAIGGGGGGYNGVSGAGIVMISNATKIYTVTGGSGNRNSGGGAAIGGGSGKVGGVGTVTISDATIIETAVGGSKGSSSSGGAAIGGGGGGYNDVGGDGNVTINGGTIVVTPTGSHYAIGGGQGRTNGNSTITIDGGSIRTTTGTLLGGAPKNSAGNSVEPYTIDFGPQNAKKRYNMTNAEVTPPCAFSSYTDENGRLYLYKTPSGSPILTGITTQPKNTAAFVDGSASFTVTAVGNYQWQKNISGTWTNITSGGILSTYIINPVAIGNAGSYRVVVTDSASNTFNSNEVTLVVLSTQPANTAAFEGKPASVSVTTTHETLPAGLSYQWYFESTPVGVNSATYTIGSMNSGYYGNYTLTVRNSTDNVSVSDQAHIKVVGNPESTAAFEGNTASFETTLTGTLPTGFSYQWQKNNSGFADITGETGTELSFSAADKTNDAGEYQLLIKNGTTVVSTSDAVWLTVVTHPSDITEFENRDITFAVTQTPEASVSGVTLTYEWYKSPDTTNPITGATTHELAMTNISPADSGSYSAKIDGITDLSDPADLTLLAHPVNQTIQEHHLTTFVVTDISGLSYQWLVDKNDTNGFVELAGETNASLSINALLNMNDWKYKVQVTGSGIDGTIESDVVVLTVTKTPSSGGYGDENVKVVDGNGFGQQQPQQNGTATNGTNGTEQQNGTNVSQNQSNPEQETGGGNNNGLPSWIWIVVVIIVIIIGGVAYWYFYKRNKEKETSDKN
ncbi:hypothetical protein [Methanolapillus millepedarum]|uniref:Immunoglobulin domain-containing protein n=1 Tax=Methanolapillus millepedarum TaxID=3028296 RepID=A0AA96VBM0_9EURY|nr:hypothetical protein MsAc7_06680 [Methanosarcinaceae archaeon Ac7]